MEVELWALAESSVDPKKLRVDEEGQASHMSLVMAEENFDEIQLGMFLSRRKKNWQGNAPGAGLAAVGHHGPLALSNQSKR